MATAEIDIPQLAAFCSLPPPTIQSLLDAPTTELVQNLLRNVSKKASYYTGLESEKLRTGVELESAVRGQETKTRSLRTQLERSNAEVAELKSKIQAERMQTHGHYRVVTNLLQSRQELQQRQS